MFWGVARGTSALVALLALLPVVRSAHPELPARQTPHPESSSRARANRNDWQRPHWVMDVLDIEPGDRVADGGAGSGYFTLHLAGRVGWGGKVYAVDIRGDALAGIGRLRQLLNLPQIETVLGEEDDPRLPDNSLDVVLVVNTYHELRAFDRMMQAFLRALKPGGLLALIDADAKTGSPRSAYGDGHRLPAAFVRDDARRNGFRFLRAEPGFTNPDDGAKWYFLVFERPRQASSGN